MYKLKIFIDADKDFYYENPLYKPDDCEHIFYYERRSEAVKDLISVISKLVETIDSKEYLKDSIDRVVREFEPKAYKIIKKIETFYIALNFGNQTIEFKLVETFERKDGVRTLYEDRPTVYDFYACQNLDNYILDYLDNLDNLDDVEE